MPNENDPNGRSSDMQRGGEQPTGGLQGGQDTPRNRDENRFGLGGSSGEGGGPQVMRGETEQRGEDRGGEDRERVTGGGDQLRSGSSQPETMGRGEGMPQVPTVGGEQPRKKQRRGFAAMDPAKQREIASKGGKASHEQGTGHEWDSEAAREAGRKGGQASRGGRGKIRPEGGSGGGMGGGV